MTEKTEITVGGILAGFACCIFVFYGIQYYTRKQNIPVSPLKTNQILEKNISMTELQTHNSQTDCWIVVSGEVYNVTTYLERHPGGAFRIIPYCGTSDATGAFRSKGGEGAHTIFATDELRVLLVGTFTSVL